MMKSLKNLGNRVSAMVGNSWLMGLLVLGLASGLVVGWVMYSRKSCPGCPACPAQQVLVPGKLETKTIETTKQTLVVDDMVAAPNAAAAAL